MDIGRVSALGLDLLIRIGPGRLSGAILHSARLGVISFGDGYDQLRSDESACFFECYEKRPKTGFSILKLTDGPKGNNVLLSGYFATKFCFSINQANVLKKSSQHLQDLLQRIAISGDLPPAERVLQTIAQTGRTPELPESVAYLFKVLYRFGKKAFYRCANVEKKWGLSFIQSNWKELDFHLRYDVTAPKGHFWADPFIFAHNGKNYCFVEDYVYRTKLGHIAVLEVTENAVVHLGNCIKEPFHLSFPFLFHYRDALYMCPEASASRQIRIYRSIEFPLKWELNAVIMHDVSAADSMLFEHAGLWWMLTSIDKSGSCDYTSELYLFSAISPLTTEWAPHPCNPIRIDSEGGRNAGMIAEDGKLFRMAQRQGYDQYGEGLLMFQVIELSETSYAERLFSRIEPSTKSGKIGTHHLSTTGEMTVLDHASRAFSP
jgi:hypothetical protein